MQKRLLFILVLCATISTACAQKYACFDSEFVLSSIPDYQQAQKRLDQYVSEWQKELENKQHELESLKVAFQQEAYLLPENLKRRRLDDLKTKEKDLKDLQYEHFGVGGDLDKKRAELIKPVQDRVYNALSRLASEKGYAIIFDKAGNSTVAYSNPKYDVSSQVLEMLGVSGSGASVKDGQADKASSASDRSSKSATNKEARGEKSQSSRMKR